MIWFGMSGTSCVICAFCVLISAIVTHLFISLITDEHQARFQSYLIYCKLLQASSKINKQTNLRGKIHKQAVISPQAWVKEMETLLSDSKALTLPDGFKSTTPRAWPNYGLLGFQGSYPHATHIFQTLCTLQSTLHYENCVDS